MVQIENAWRNPKEQRTGAVQRGHVREIKAVGDNLDAEPVMPCEATKTAIIVYGKQLGRKLTVCTDKNCPVHDSKAAAELAAHPTPVMEPPTPTETDEEAEEREQQNEQRRKEYEEDQQRREDERKQQFEQEQAEYEAEQNRRAETLKAREAALERIVEQAPAAFSATQLRAFLCALINLEPYDFAEDVAAFYVGGDENNQQTPEEVLATTLASLPDEKLTGFALRLALTGHVGIPREGESDFLSEAVTAFVPPPPKKKAGIKKAKHQTLNESSAKATTKVRGQKAASSTKKIAA